MEKDILEMRKKLIVNSKVSKNWIGIIIRSVITIVAIAYTIMPVDFIPDAVPFFGGMDDSGLWLANIGMYIKEINKNKAQIESIVKELGELLK
jgi:uncharacterized membrane protein YkvA (DUF1232 family)